MALEDFLEGERTGGTSVGGEATFTLDPKKVRERVAHFCAQDSLYPFWRLLQALVVVSQGDIFGRECDTSTWEFRFRWDECPQGSAFEQLLNLGTTSGFDHVGHRVGQHLFLGLSAALGREEYAVSWRGPQASFRLKRGDVILEDPIPEDMITLTLSMESSWWGKLTRSGSFPNAYEELRYRLSYSPKPIHLNGERLVPEAPRAPHLPWAAKLITGSELAWRFLRKADQNDLTVPYPELDFYRCSGESFHLIREPEGRRIPLSVLIHDPDRAKLVRGQTHNLSLSQADRAHTALFLSLESGRHDWIIPVSDGVLCEPVETDISGGGVVCLTSERSLAFDLSGLRVVQNEAFERLTDRMKRESRSLKKQLAISVANIGVRAESIPSHYDQALGYLTGGPYLGFLTGRMGPRLRRFFSKRIKS